jgi:tetratricopeptide (TPR) repeat protein
VDDPSFLETLRMHLFGRERGTVSSFVSRMWVLANRYDGQAEPLRYLGWYLVSVGDWAELELLVGRLERQKVQAAAAEQARLYRGILAARREAWKEAEDSFGSATPTWQASFDAGLAALADGRATESHAYFETAISQLEDPALRVAARDRDAARAVVLIFDGLAYGVGGRYAEAYRRVSRAAELDPESTRARYLVARFADRL